jgi:hypothetical protein
MCQDVPESAKSPSNTSYCKTNPPRLASLTAPGRADEPLTDSQFAAVRLTVRGLGSVKVARHLGLNHHTIARWKRDPRFAAEVDQLRARATAAVAQPRDVDRRSRRSVAWQPVAWSPGEAG